MTTPEEYGGYGGSILDASIMWDEQSYSGCTGPGFAIHSDICGPYIVNQGTEEQKHQWMPKLCTCVCLRYKVVASAFAHIIDGHFPFSFLFSLFSFIFSLFSFLFSRAPG